MVDAAKARVSRGAHRLADQGFVLSRDGRSAYVASFDTHWGGSVDVIDTAINEITAKVGIGGAPMQMALSGDGARLYIADYEHVAVLCTETNSVIDTLAVTANLPASRSARTARGSTSPTTRAPSRSVRCGGSERGRRPSS